MAGPGKPGPRGHIPTETTRDLVLKMVGAAGCTQAQIALVLDIDENTLRKHYPRELARGKAVAVAKMGESLWNQAMKGNLGAKIFWLKAQGGWREKQVIEHQMTDGDGEADPREDLADLLRRYHASNQKKAVESRKQNAAAKKKATRKKVARKPRKKPKDAEER